MVPGPDLSFFYCSCGQALFLGHLAWALCPWRTFLISPLPPPTWGPEPQPRRDPRRWRGATWGQRLEPQELAQKVTFAWHIMLGGGGVGRDWELDWKVCDLGHALGRCCPLAKPSSSGS